MRLQWWAIFLLPLNYFESLKDFQWGTNTVNHTERRNMFHYLLCDVDDLQCEFDDKTCVFDDILCEIDDNHTQWTKLLPGAKPLSYLFSSVRQWNHICPPVHLSSSHTRLTYLSLKHIIPLMLCHLLILLHKTMKLFK